MAKRIIMTVLVLLIAGIVGALALLQFYSRGTPAPFVDGTGAHLTGSISQKLVLPINGVDQGMIIKWRDARNPVLLYLHGGMPDYFLTRDFPTGLDDYFTVVWRDQRGSGLSFAADIPPDTITPDQLIADARAMTRYLQDCFGQERIHLMGHSGGTFLGLQGRMIGQSDRYHGAANTRERWCLR